LPFAMFCSIQWFCTLAARGESGCDNFFID
jgi:hypothetical protein